jgi:NosR/NirI family nitrous oxide reductase transcriptional regulator
LNLVRTARFLSLSAAIYYLGLIKAGGLSVTFLLSILLLRLPHIEANIFWYSLVLFFLISTILGGRFYCGWLCPFGTVLEFSNKAAGIITRKKFSLPANIDSRLKLLKYFLLIGPLSAGIILGSARVFRFEPFAAFFRFSAAGLMLFWLVVIIGISLFSARFWCRYLCPLGALGGILSSRCIAKLKIKDGCTKCNECVKICPVGALYLDEKEDRPICNMNECIRCGECIQVCPVKVIKWF